MVGSGPVRLSQTRPIPRSPDGDNNILSHLVSILHNLWLERSISEKSHYQGQCNQNDNIPIIYYITNGQKEV